MGDDLRGQGVVLVHEAEVGLEGWRGVGWWFWGLEHADVVGRGGRKVGVDGAGQGV